jgi:hypothetical protein
MRLPGASLPQGIFPAVKFHRREMESEFNPVVILQPEEIASIAAIMGHPGFKAYNKVWRSAVDAFVIPLINTPLEEEDRILKLHMAAKVVSQLFTSVVEQVNEQVDQFISSRPSDKPVDVTSSLDMGGLTAGDNSEDLDNLI